MDDLNQSDAGDLERSYHIVGECTRCQGRVYSREHDGLCRTCYERVMTDARSQPVTALRLREWARMYREVALLNPANPASERLVKQAAVWDAEAAQLEAAARGEVA